jgi:xanthine/uracil permease
MEKPKYIYDLDDRPPLHYTAVYGLQWTVIVFPALIIVAALSAKALDLEMSREVHFFQLILLTSGCFTVLQSLWGHRYPIIDGPATALLLTFIILVPYGIQNIQGGTILGGLLLISLVLTGKLKKVVGYATPNVVGVILMLIAFTLLPHLVRSMCGVDGSHPFGRVEVLLMSFGLVVFMAALSHWLSGFWKTVALLVGIVVGALLFLILGLPNLEGLVTARWFSLPSRWTTSRPSFYWPAVLAFTSSYLAVVVNSLGSLHGVANLTETERLPSAVTRGIFVNGLAGIVCGLLGIIGMVSYSMSPGVILANRVASRYAVTCCGVILVVAAFAPKLAALLSMVPAPVVGAALCVAMGAQVGAGLGIVSSGGLSGRDYYVVGLPVLMGTMVGFLPDGLMGAMPTALRVFLGNGLIVGIFLVLTLEHLLLRKSRDHGSK